MRVATLALLTVLGAAASPTLHMRYQRSLTVPAAGPACVVLAPSIYAHAAGSLADLRLLSADGKREIPYVLTMSQAAAGENEPAQVTNVRQQGRFLAFDLIMPHRAYTDVQLDLASKDFIATAMVTGRSPQSTPLGSFTLFDLSAQGLTRKTKLPLQESNYPVLHVRLVPSIGSQPLTPDMLRGASVPPSREAQTLYTPALTTRRLEKVGTEIRATFVVPPHLPIERIAISVAPGFTKSFRRQVRVTSRAAGDSVEAGEQIAGTVDRVHLRQDGMAISDEHLTIPATLGANLQSPAEVQVAILNGDQPLLPVTAITLETREHQLCFPAPDSRSAVLFYGDSKLEAPSYDFARTFRPAAGVQQAMLGPEQANPGYKPRADDRPLLKRHPRLIYLGSILVVCLLAVIGFRTGKLHL